MTDIKEIAQKLLSLGLDGKFFKLPIKSVKPAVSAVINQFKTSCSSAKTCLDYFQDKHVGAFKTQKEALETLVKGRFESLAVQAMYDFYGKNIEHAVEVRDNVIQEFKDLSCADIDAVADLDEAIEKSRYPNLKELAETRGYELADYVEGRIEDVKLSVESLVEDTCPTTSTDLLFNDLKTAESNIKDLVVEATENVLYLKGLISLLATEGEVLEVARYSKLSKDVYDLIKKSSDNRIAIEANTINDLHKVFSDEITDIQDTLLNSKLKKGGQVSDMGNNPRITLEHVFGDQVGTYKKATVKNLVKVFKGFDEKTLDELFQCRKSSDSGDCIEEINNKNYKEISKKCHPDKLDEAKSKGDLETVKFCSKLAHHYGVAVEDVFLHVASEKSNFDSAVSDGGHWIGGELDNQYNHVHQCLGHHANQLSGEEFWIWAKDFGCL